MAKKGKNADYQKPRSEKKAIQRDLMRYRRQKCVRAIVLALCICVFGSIILCIATGMISLGFFISFLQMFLVWGGIPIIAANIFIIWKGNPNTKIGFRSIIAYFFATAVASFFNASVRDFGFSTYLLTVSMSWTFLYSNTE